MNLKLVRAVYRTALEAKWGGEANAAALHYGIPEMQVPPPYPVAVYDGDGKYLGYYLRRYPRDTDRRTLTPAEAAGPELPIYRDIRGVFRHALIVRLPDGWLLEELDGPGTRYAHDLPETVKSQQVYEEILATMPAALTPGLPGEIRARRLWV